MRNASNTADQFHIRLISKMAAGISLLFPGSLKTLFIFAAFLAQVNGELAILHAVGPLGVVDSCALYNPHFGSLPQKLANTPAYEAQTPYRHDGCSDYREIMRFWNATSFVYAKNCSNYQKLTKAQQAGAKQVIIISKKGDDYPSGTKDQFNYIHIPVGMVLQSSWDAMQSLGQPLIVQFWHPHDSLFDPNLLIIWILACFCVAVGSYWSGVTTKDRQHDFGSDIFDVTHWGLIRPMDKPTSPRISKEGDSLVDEDEEDSLKITPITIIVFIGVICTILLLLYFFYKYLIYVVIGLFAIAACNGTFDCLKAILNHIKCGTYKTPTLPVIKCQLEYRMIVLFFFCMGLVIWWIIKRHASYSWVLQDFLGVCFCCSLIKLIKLPNLKVSALLLMSLLVYDIFFVFITPLFSARGKSVMVEVATGKGSKEQLPMVIRVPKLIKSALSLCERPYSLLGFGDILLPGLFVGFCRNFDIVAEVPKSLYFLVSLIGYGIGMFITFVALVFMKSGQPALLYLVPSVLFPVTIVALLKGQFKNLWYGRIKTERRESCPELTHVESDNKTEADPKQGETRPLLPPGSTSHQN